VTDYFKIIFCKKEVYMKINNGVGNFAISKKVTESKFENTNSGSLSRTNEGNSKISEPSLSIVGGNSGNGGGQFRKLDIIVQSEPEIRMDLVNKFKELLKSGEYKNDSDKISSKMISESLVEDIL
jgi:anti-sigma28 factor (negative regulator of flagellin synthesis)